MQPPPGVIAAAQAAAHQWRVPASILLAQWAYESDWGQRVAPDSNNPFGIKSRLNAAGIPIDLYVEARPAQTLGRQVQHIAAPIRKFASIADAFDHHAELLATAHLYGPTLAVRTNPAAFARALNGRYETDPQYAAKLLAISQGSRLHQYDVPMAC